MPSSRPKEFCDDLIGDRFPALLWTSLACVHERQSPSVCYEDRQLPAHLVTVHPMEGVPDCGDSKRLCPERNVLGPGPQLLDVLSVLSCSQKLPLGDHVCIWIDGDNLADRVGQRNCDGAWTASQI
jgi:hypothetical protein